MPNLEAVLAKHAPEESASAEAAPDVPSAPPAGTSAAASAPAGVEAPAGQGSPASPGASIDHETLAAKLAHDRNVRASKEARRRAKAHEDSAAQTKKAAEEELAKWQALGKDKSWLDAIKASGRDPREVFESMRQEALKSGTPDARIDALEKKLAEEQAARTKLETERAEEKKAAEEAAKQREAERLKHQESQVFETDFRENLANPKYAPLLEEYEPRTLFQLANGLKNEPDRIFQNARALKVPLTRGDGHFTMVDIFNVMHAVQSAHRERMQRRTQSAAPHTSQTPVTQESEARPTVNGTAARKAESPSTLGNDLVTSRASETEKLKGMSREERREYLANKYPHAR